MSRVGRLAIAMAFASGLGIAGATAATFQLSGGGTPFPLGTGVGPTGDPPFNPGPGFPTAELAGLDWSNSNLALRTQVTPFTGLGNTGGLQISFLAAEDPSFVKFTYLGSEAGNTNFSFDNILLFDTATSNVGDNVTHSFDLDPVPGSPAILPFKFVTNGLFTGNPGAAAINGGAVDPALLLGFAVSSDGKTAWAFFEDGLPDTDVDDMVIRLEIVPPGANEVPLPPATLLFGSALAAMGLLGMRRRRSSRRS